MKGKYLTCRSNIRRHEHETIKIGDAMGDIGDTFREWDKVKKEKKASNLIYSANLLTDKGVEFESKSGGVHLVVFSARDTYDFWPSTGKWKKRGTSRYGRGVHKLLAAINLARPDFKINKLEKRNGKAEQAEYIRPNQKRSNPV